MLKRHHPAVLTLGILAILAPARARADEDENWQRLRSMPREQRLILSENLKKFDALDPGQKAVIRGLDEKLAQLPAENRLNAYSVLRRYRLWVDGLPREQRDLLKSTPPDQRMPLVRKFLAEERSAARKPNALLFQLAELNATSPIDVAHRLKIWFALTPEERAECERMPPEKRRSHMEELGRKKKVAAIRRLTLADEERALESLLANPLLKDRLSNRLAEFKKTLEASRKVDEVKKVENARRKVADNYYFLEHPPEKVAPESLLRFDAALPSWIRTPLDHLPPEEARRRLTILYRLVFPAGTEMPANFQPTAPSGSTATSTPSPAPPAATQAREPAKGSKSSSPNPF
jgi:hypothetical protein